MSWDRASADATERIKDFQRAIRVYRAAKRGESLGPEKTVTRLRKDRKKAPPLRAGSNTLLGHHRRLNDRPDQPVGNSSRPVCLYSSR